MNQNPTNDPEQGKTSDPTAVPGTTDALSSYLRNTRMMWKLFIVAIPFLLVGILLQDSAPFISTICIIIFFILAFSGAAYRIKKAGNIERMSPEDILEAGKPHNFIPKAPEPDQKQTQNQENQPPK